MISADENSLAVRSLYDGGLKGLEIPQSMPRAARNICIASWNWSAGNSRKDNYFLHKGRSYWYLWLVFYDGCEGDTTKVLVGRMLKAEAKEEQAAVVLMTEYWRLELNETDLDRPHSCSSDFLSDETLSEIGDLVWARERRK